MIRRNSYDAAIAKHEAKHGKSTPPTWEYVGELEERIAELKKERDAAVDRVEMCNLSDWKIYQETDFAKKMLAIRDLTQQAKGIEETATEINNIYVKEQQAGKLGVNQFYWWCLILGHMNDKAKALEEASNPTSDSFTESVFEIAFGDDAINRDFSKDEVIAKLREFSDLALDALEENAERLLKD